MMRILIAAVVAAVVGGGLYAKGYGPAAWLEAAKTSATEGSASQKPSVPEPPRPAVSVVAVAPSQFVDTQLVTGSLVARREVLVAPEVEGLRIKSFDVEEGETVKRDQVLATLEQATIEAQLAQSMATLARSSAAIAQAASQITMAEARLTEAKANFDRAQPLRKSGALSESIYDQREAAALTAEAQLTAARDGLKLAEAERGQVEAQRRDLMWRQSRTEIRSPVDGLVSRRTLRVGAVATAIGEPLFRLAAGSEIELEAEVPEADMARLQAGQRARVTVAGAGEVTGQVRLVSPEVDKSTRLGKVRVMLGVNPVLRIGAFGRGQIEVASSRGLAVPASAVMFVADGPQALIVVGDTVETRRIRVGLIANDQAEVTEGLAEGDLVVARAGTFLRAGDRVRAVRQAVQKVSGVE